MSSNTVAPLHVADMRANIDSARGDIIDAACSHAFGREVLTDWFTQAKTGTLSADALMGKPYPGRNSNFMSASWEIVKQCRSLNALEQVGPSDLSQNERSLSQAVRRLVPSDDRLLGLAIVLRQKIDMPGEHSLRTHIGTAASVLKSAGAYASPSDLGQIELCAQNAKPASISVTRYPMHSFDGYDLEDVAKALTAAKSPKPINVSRKPEEHPIADPKDIELDAWLRAAPVRPDPFASSGEAFWQTSLSQFPVMKEKMPEILSACKGRKIETARDLVKTIVSEGVAPGNARKQVHGFLEGEILLPPPSTNQFVFRTGLTLTAVRIANALEIEPRTAFSRFDVPKEAFRHLPKPQIQFSQPLDQFEILHSQMPELEQGLKEHGIITRRQLEIKLIKQGAHPTDVGRQIRHVLTGNVFMPNSKEFTPTAERISKLGGLAPEAAYQHFMEPSARLPIQPLQSRPLSRMPFMRQARELLTGLAHHGLTSEDDIAALFEGKEADRSLAQDKAKTVLEGNILANGNLELSSDAKRLADAAGLNYWDAYKRKIREAFQRANTEGGRPSETPN